MFYYSRYIGKNYNKGKQLSLTHGYIKIKIGLIKFVRFYFITESIGCETLQGIS